MSQIDPIVRIATEQNGRLDRWDEDLRDHLQSMKFIDNATRPDKMTLQFNDPTLEFRHDERFAVGAKIAVLFGYPGNTYGDGPVVFEVKAVKGFRVLTVEGPTVESRTLLGRQYTRTWEDATEFEVAEEIARNKGFADDTSRDIDPGDYAVIRRGITQAGETDLAFLRRIAGRVDCVCYTSGGVFHFHPPRYDGVPRKLLTYFDSERGEFTADPEIEITPLGRAGRATTAGVSTRENAAVTGTAGNSDDPGRIVNGIELAVTDPGPTEWVWENPDIPAALGNTEWVWENPEETGYAQEFVAPTTETTDSGAQRSARRTFRSSERETVKLSASVVGDPELVAGETVRIEGLGPQLSGNYYLEEVEHNISSGYDTKISKAKKNALGRSGATATRRRQHRNAAGNDIADRDSGPMTTVAEPWETELGLDPNCRINDEPAQDLVWVWENPEEEVAE